MNTGATTNDPARVGSILAELEQVSRGLTDLQRAIIKLIVQGYSRNTIATLLGVSDPDIRTNLRTLKITFTPPANLSEESWNAMWGTPTPINTLVEAFTGAWASNAAHVDRLDLDDVAEIGREAGVQAAAAAAWRQGVGEILDTKGVSDLLGISRQALDSRKRTGSVLALPGTGTSHYPTWQFDVDVDGARSIVRPITLRIVTTFREVLDDFSPYTIAAWATSPQPELDGRSPAEWIIGGGDDGPVVRAAQRAAHLETL